MGVFRKILVAVDGSESSLHALKEAMHLAKASRGRVLAVSVIPPYRGDLRFAGLKNIRSLLSEPCEKALQEAEKLADAEQFDLSVACLEGEPHEEIVDLAESESCDLIVLGVGSGSMERYFVMGSIPARVIGYSTKDVLVVPDQATVGWQRLLAATDGSKLGENAVERALALAKYYEAELSVVSATDFACEMYSHAPEVGESLVKKAKTNVEGIESKAKVMGVETECFVREGEAHKAIIAMAEQKGAQLIILGSHGRTGLKRLLMGSVVEKVIAEARYPVLVIRT